MGLPLSVSREHPDAEVRMCLVYLKYWTLNRMPLMVYPEVLFHLNFSIKAEAQSLMTHRPAAATDIFLECVSCS